MRFKEGDYVRIIEREATPADVKNRTYYPFFGGLSGTVDKIYDNEICIRVDAQSMTKDMSKRHTDIQESIRRKWLNGLSGEVRNKLTGDEKRFDLAYTILVQSADLEKSKPSAPQPVEIKSKKPLNPVEEPIQLEPDEEVEPAQLSEAAEPMPEEEANGLTEAELAFLREREARIKGE